MSDWIRRSLSLCLAAAVLHVYSFIALAAPAEKGAGATGVLSTVGRVLLDGNETITGMTLFPGSELRTAEDSRAVISLGSRGRAELMAQSGLKLDFGGDTLRGSLDSGGVRVSKPAEVSATVETAAGSVAADPRGPAVFSVRYEGGRVSVEAHAGSVTFRGAGEPVRVEEGTRYTAGQGAPAASNSLSNEEKTALWLGIGGAVALIIIILATRDDEDDDTVTPPNPSPVV